MPDLAKRAYQLVGLGSGKTLVSTSPEGAIQAIKGDVELSVFAKDIIEISGNPVITASGFDKINKLAGLSLVMPNKIDVPGYGTQPNPFFITDDATGGVRFVMAKMSSVGYSPVGNLAVVDQTLMFDLLSYFKMDCLAKIKKIAGLGKLAYKDQLTEAEQKCGYFIPVLDKNYGIWMNTAHPEFIRVINDHSQRQRFAERIALGILKRNCLRHHPAIGIMNVQLEKGGTCKIPILAWRKALGMEEIRRISEDKSAREAAGAKTIEETIDTEALHAEETAVDIAEAVSDSVKTSTPDVSDSLSSKEEKPIKVDTKLLSDREKNEIRISEMREAIGEENWDKFYKATVTSGRTLNEFSDEELDSFAERVRELCQKLKK